MKKKTIPFILENKSRGGMRAEDTFIPHRWACCDVNQIDDESLG